MRETKAELRKRVREMAPQVRDEEICRTILAHSWFLEAKTVMAYMALAGEISLKSVIQAALELGKILLLPRCEADGSMTARVISDMKCLRQGAFGILEPPGDAAIFSPEKIDLILTPAMAYDQRGRRLGRGKGYFDRFLQKTTGRTIGVSSVLLEEVPVEQHDIPVDAVAWSRGLILCGTEDENGRER